MTQNKKLFSCDFVLIKLPIYLGLSVKYEKIKSSTFDFIASFLYTSFVELHFLKRETKKNVLLNSERLT